MTSPNKGILTIMILSFCCCLSSVQPAEAKLQSRFKTVSLIRLIAEPRLYNGLFIEVSGYVSQENGEYSIYISEDDAEYGITKNGLILKADATTFDSSLIGRYCLIRGRFDPEIQGEGQAFSGAIRDIREIEIRQPSRAVAEFKKQQLRKVISPIFDGGR